MHDKKATFALFFPQPMDNRDSQNLVASGVKRVQLFLGVAKNTPAQLDYLQSQGVKVTLRVEEPDAGHKTGSYYNTSNHQQLVRDVQFVRGHVDVEAVIVGNEPQGFYDLHRGSANWGNNPEGEYPQGRAYEHQFALKLLRVALKDAMPSVKVVTPGYKRGRVRPEQEPEPGNFSWGRICAGEYNKCDAGGIHVYEDAWASVEDQNRFKWAVGEELDRVHTAVWLNECNINTKQVTELDRMRAVLAMYDLLAGLPWANSVITSFCPFVSNGLSDQEWSHMIMRNWACYSLLASWIGT